MPCLDCCRRSSFNACAALADAEEVADDAGGAGADDDDALTGAALHADDVDAGDDARGGADDAHDGNACDDAASRAKHRR